MLSVGLFAFIFTDVHSAQFVRKVLWSKTGAVAGVLAGYEGWKSYDVNKRFIDACDASDSSLSYEQQDAVREIFGFHGVDKVHIVDAEEVMERFGESCPSLGTLKTVTFPKNILIIPVVERLLLDHRVVSLVNPNTGKKTTFYRDGVEAALHHEATHCKHNDCVEKIGHQLLKSSSFALLVGQAAYLKAGGGKKAITIGIGSLTVAATYIGARYASAFRSHQIEKRCDLSIPTSHLMRASAYDMETEDCLLKEAGIKKEETFLDEHPLTVDRIAYMREAADRLERQGK